jgi:hypothetical protein
MARNAALPIPTAEPGLTHYLGEIRRFPMLERQEEYLLAKRWREHGDRDAAHELVTSHLRLVTKIARDYRGYGLPISEAISEGNVGGGTHRIQRVLALALRVKYPSGCDLPLNIHLFRPVTIFCVTELVPQLRKLGDVDLGGLRIIRTGRPECSREIRNRLHVRQGARAHLKFRRGLPVAALDRETRRRNSQRIRSRKKNRPLSQKEEELTAFLKLFESISKSVKSK